MCKLSMKAEQLVGTNLDTHTELLRASGSALVTENRVALLSSWSPYGVWASAVLTF